MSGASIDPRISVSTEAARLIDSVPAGSVNYAEFHQDLPDFLTAALEMILTEVDADPGTETTSAAGCRILAACIARLRV